MLSRVADNLYWMSRYLERAEHTARLIDVYLDLILDQPAGATRMYWSRLFESLNMPLPAMEEAQALTHYAAFDTANPASILSCVASARENARQVREQISSEMWEQINGLYLYVRTVSVSQDWYEEPHQFFLKVKEGSHLFQGITDSTMNHNQGWYFIQVGRFIERSVATPLLLDVHYRTFDQSQDMVSRNYQDWIALLKSCTAFEAYCKVYSADPHPHHIADFLLLNPHFPHAICFSVNSLQHSLKAISDFAKSRRSGRINRLSGRLQALLDYAQIDEIMTGGLHEFLESIRNQCQQLHYDIYQTYIDYPVEQEMAS